MPRARLFMHSAHRPSASARRLAFLSAAFVVAILSCGREPTAPGTRGASGIQYARGLSFRPIFPAGVEALQQASGSGVADFTHVHVVLHHSDGTVALDTMVDFPAGATSINVLLNVRFTCASRPGRGVCTG